MKIATITTLIPLILLIACSEPESEPTTADMPATTTNETQTPPIKVKVILTPKAEAAINAGETIIVSPSYYGIPKPGETVPEDWRGFPYITLAVERYEMTKPGIITLPAPEFDPYLLQFTLPDSYGVNINVGSGRKKSDDNILDCEVFEDSLKVAIKEEISLSCDLL